MTNDNQAEHLVEDRTNKKMNGEELFHIVLVDIKKAAFKKEIHCVKKPLTSTDHFKFVALSYRAGEVQETMIDTQVGYVAKLTSFDLDSFFLLCCAMIREAHLKPVEYVWVDAICIDQDPQKRRETMYQMSHIYEQATFIVAVPDLHLRYLRDINKSNAAMINNATKLSYYIYHLLHGHTGTIAREDEYFLNHLKIDDPHLRYLLTNYTEHFADGFMNGKGDHHNAYDADDALTHLFEANAAKYMPPRHNQYNRAPNIYKKLLQWMGGSEKKNIPHKDDPEKRRFTVAHQCHTPEACLFDRSHEKDEEIADDSGACFRRWRHAVLERSRMICQSVTFMTDLLQDWSTRVWVISEYHMARKKKESHKMKYWFLQLTHPSTGLVSSDNHCRPLGDSPSHVTFGSHRHADDDDDDPYFFFEFDVNGGDDSSGLKSYNDNDTLQDMGAMIKHHHPSHYTNAVYQTFHSTMRKQLGQRTFLEMMLKSKATRHEDRLYAILPLSEYKHKLTNQDQRDHWRGMDSLVSVKLQLYEWTSTKDKLALLFLSNHADYLGKITPTFATSNILWPESGVGYDPMRTMMCCQSSVVESESTFLNFDVTNQHSKTPAITLTRIDGGLHKLTIKPLEYHVNLGWHKNSAKVKQNVDEFATLCRLLRLDHVTPDVICIPALTLQGMKTYRRGAEQQTVNHFIYLIGSLAENKWILKSSVLYGFCGCIMVRDEDDYSCQGEWEHRTCDETSPGFDIY